MVREYGGKVAVVTGAGNGLGRALAKELAARNCNLALVDIDSSAVANTKEELARPGLVVTYHCADVSSEQSLALVAAEVKNFHGTAHLLINNAGVSASASFRKYRRYGIRADNAGQLFWGCVWLSRVSTASPRARRRPDSQRIELFRVAGISSQNGLCILKRRGSRFLRVAPVGGRRTWSGCHRLVPRSITHVSGSQRRFRFGPEA